MQRLQFLIVWDKIWLIKLQNPAELVRKAAFLEKNMNILKIQEIIRIGDYQVSFHSEKERYAEDISIRDIETAILNGEIIENYPYDIRGQSCLILGYSKGRAIHIVCGLTSEQSLRIITVYLPKSPKWSDDRTRRK
jgi:hypothetical protein